jgi:hypothetical protein
VRESLIVISKLGRATKRDDISSIKAVFDLYLLQIVNADFDYLFFPARDGF